MKFEINIPENLNEITLGQYQELLRLEEPTDGDIVRILLDIDLKGLGTIKDSDVDKYSERLTKLFDNKPSHSLKFNLQGVTFGFLPNIDEITYGENKDVTSYLNDWQTMHKAMSVLYRPITNKIGNKYLLEPYGGTHKHSELMKQMPLGVVFGAMVFFWTLTNDLLKAIPNYLQKEAQKELMSGQISVENGEAIRKYTHLLRETLEDLQKLQTFPYIVA